MVAYLHANLDESAKDLNLVLWDELGEGDEESNLESLQSVVVHLVQEQASVAEYDSFNHVASDGDNVGR